MNREFHERWMEVALEEAGMAARRGEVPIGAAAVRDGSLLARAGNRTESRQDPTAHAEMLVLRRAAAALRVWRLTGVTLYVTLEPCAMCAGACVLSRIDRLVFGADDPKAGMCGSLDDLVRDPRLNHRVELLRGVRAAECGALLQGFFRSRRRSRASDPAAGHELVDHDDEDHHEEQVDEAAGVEDEAAQQPQDQQDDHDRPEHL